MLWRFLSQNCLSKQKNKRYCFSQLPTSIADVSDYLTQYYSEQEVLKRKQAKDDYDTATGYRVTGYFFLFIFIVVLICYLCN